MEQQCSQRCEGVRREQVCFHRPSWIVVTNYLLTESHRATASLTDPQRPISTRNNLTSMKTKTLVVSIIASTVLFAFLVALGVGVHNRRERENRNKAISAPVQSLNRTVRACA